MLHGSCNILRDEFLAILNNHHDEFGVSGVRNVIFIVLVVSHYDCFAERFYFRSLKEFPSLVQSPCVIIMRSSGNLNSCKSIVYFEFFSDVCHK